MHYPYGEVDVILDDNFWFGGMEYPGLTMDTTSSNALIHELGHQWFYGIVGDDEYNTPWLDEGFTDYITDVQEGLTGANCWTGSWASSSEAIAVVVYLEQFEASFLYTKRSRRRHLTCHQSRFAFACTFDLWPDNKNAEKCPDNGRVFVASLNETQT